MDGPFNTDKIEIRYKRVRRPGEEDTSVWWFRQFFPPGSSEIDLLKIWLVGQTYPAALLTYTVAGKNQEYSTVARWPIFGPHRHKSCPVKLYADK
jgi:hypothetical protein